MNDRSREPIRIPQPNGYFALKAGSAVRVKNCHGAYQLPSGLKEGDTIRILAFEAGYYTVEKGGLTFSIFMANLQAKMRTL